MADLNLSRPQVNAATGDQQQQLHGAVRPASPTQDRQPDDIQRPRLEGHQAASNEQQRLQATTGADLAATRHQAPALQASTNHDQLVRFWQALHAGQVTEQVFRRDPDANEVDDPPQAQVTRFLTLPDGVFWLGNSTLGSVLMVRSCYDGLFDAIINPPANPEPHPFWMDPRVRPTWVVTGNPGIGKTFFLAYFVYRLFLQHPQLAVVYEPAQPIPAVRYVLQPDQSVTQDRISFDSFSSRLLWAPNPETWYLVDGSSGHSSNVNTLLVTSPRGGLGKLLEKNANPMMFMPVWSWDELVACLRQQNAAEERLQAAEERYYRWGGIARHVFDDELSLSESERRLNAAISNRTIASFRDLDLFTVEPDLSHGIFHIEVLPDGNPFQRTKITFASRWVAGQVLKRALATERGELMNFLRGSF
ncbi:hypothetical protein CAOG_08836 [Capsaspora owczarzaki ATCC 30864]|uniref:Uncharacterized protein n=1 Tax=Capsaspora owczarzaki (strain ATCC 30864) TaxID=595528 RepID=A0A0D2X3F0_CAPO3|nr:hypothetical protein CAOG_08836 [Capsaspora owczarzaki ATCC 30864]KJE94194.1 hypothetical protein CAOG_008836 [Capsaspora owczarzaki ATCC 30864]|eukprot:XP_011270477.1 hypothetical protein CAOG_08836 [Capsaspora owczarzaki ATCC 30864]